MVHGSSSFNQEIVNVSKWNVPNVTYMNHRFHGATSFDQNVTEWDVSKTETAVEILSGAKCR